MNCTKIPWRTHITMETCVSCGISSIVHLSSISRWFGGSHTIWKRLKAIIPIHKHETNFHVARVCFIWNIKHKCLCWQTLLRLHATLTRSMNELAVRIVLSVLSISFSYLHHARTHAQNLFLCIHRERCRYSWKYFNKITQLSRATISSGERRTFIHSSSMSVRVSRSYRSSNAFATSANTHYCAL